MKNNLLVDKVIGLYQDSGWKKYFSKIRFWDAPYLEVEKIVPKKGVITDIGCGEGIFSNFLGVTSPLRKVTGIELDRTRVEQADHGIKNVSFKKGDATKTDIQASDGIVLFHLLHHLRSFSDQEKVIRNCYKALKVGGKLIIVEVDIKPTVKYLISWITDHFIVPILFEKKVFEKDIYFRKRREWEKLLTEIGFDVKSFPAEEGKPFTHIIFNCTKGK